MQSDVLKTRTMVFIFKIALLISSFTKNNNLENQITVKINSIDNETKQPRVKMFETIDVRISEFVFPMRKYVKVAEYITDSTGSVKIKIDSAEEYRFMISRPNVYGSANFIEAFSKEKLKDGQEVNIEVIFLENR